MSNGLDQIRDKHQTLAVNNHAESLILGYIDNSLESLLLEADKIARKRGGNDIQSGDIKKAIKRIERRTPPMIFISVFGPALLGLSLKIFYDNLIGGKTGIEMIAPTIIFLISVALIYLSSRKQS